ncbi:hypothetical protein MSAN_01516000 [Mycena sanguinolenta]|uniref:Uncharacterized protein n=1 Tax=Mycena sanguinolenta TaxID=230812 RepID=A0A8H6Y6W2_9AGAR|nr:hypothetical protein MSAN_01516000 [Mycena sanguinolenta]
MSRRRYYIASWLRSDIRHQTAQPTAVSTLLHQVLQEERDVWGVGLLSKIFLDAATADVLIFPQSTLRYSRYLFDPRGRT